MTRTTTTPDRRLGGERPMTAMTRRTWLAVLGLLPAAGLVSWAEGSDKNRKKETHIWEDIPPRELIRRRHLPDVELVTHRGRTVRFYEDLVKDKKLGFTYADPLEDANKANHVGMLRLGNEPYLRWAACPGQAHPAWIAKSILLEMDGPTRPAATGAG